MASYQRNIVHKIVIYLFFLSFTIANPDYDMAQCVHHVRKYCMTEKNYPRAMTCIREVIRGWRGMDIEDGIFRNYTLTFPENVEIKAGMKKPSSYCDEYGPFFGPNCRYILRDIPDSIEHGLNYALYRTTVPICKQDLGEIRYRLYYLRHVYSNIAVGHVQKPWIYCKERSYPGLVGPFDWRPYLRADAENDIDDEIVNDPNDFFRDWKYRNEGEENDPNDDDDDNNNNNHNDNVDHHNGNNDDVNYEVDNDNYYDDNDNNGDDDD